MKLYSLNILLIGIIGLIYPKKFYGNASVVKDEIQEFPNKVNMKLAMEKYEIVPEILDEAPEHIIEILYFTGVRVKVGNELTPTQVREPPLLSWRSEPNATHTLIMIDPDAPQRDNPKYANLLLWMVVNIPTNHVENGETLCEYIGAIPPPNSNLHRYIFLVYKQKIPINTQNEPYIFASSYSARKGFSLEKFARKYFLHNPIAINFFTAQWDEYVPLVREQFID